MIKPTLVILAAGMASRYGSMKQTEGFGPNGETIMEYSIYDAIRAGFGKVVFIIRKDFFESFSSNINPKLEGKIEVAFVFQERDSFVIDKANADNREKPWGTGHAMLCAKGEVSGPFAIINADDFYGLDAFKKAFDFCVTECNAKTNAIIGYELAKTLSENGTVSRGVCTVGAEGNLINIKEHTKIYPKNGKIIFEEGDNVGELAIDTKVSMNFLCFHPSIFNLTANLFVEFEQANTDKPRAEFYIPYVGQQFIERENGTIKVIPTSAQWFGVTYKEDAPLVQEQLNELIAGQYYPEKLW